MFGLAEISFAAPWALAGLAVLPLLWWLLRVTPPAPWRLRFPPIRFLLDLVTQEESAARTPWWLLVLRLVLAALVIVAAAQPLMNAAGVLRGSGPVVIIVDDGWASARDWPARRTYLANLVDEVERAGRTIAIVTTAPPAAGTIRPPPQLMQADDARRLIEAIQPKPWPTRRSDALAGLADGVIEADRPGDVVWLSDGLAEGDAGALLAPLRRLGGVSIVRHRDGRTPVVLRAPRGVGQDLTVTAARVVRDAPATIKVRVVGEDGTPLARQPLSFAAGEATGDVEFELPTELRNRVARLVVEDEQTAAAVVLLDERWRRRPVGLVGGGGLAGDQPLLSDLYYLQRALEPFTEVRHGGVADLLRRRLAVLVLADPGPLGGSARRDLERWIADGGVAVRFAGPRLAQDSDVLLPVPLRAGDRMLGGAMSWQRPATLAPFEESSPFHGLGVPPGVTVRRQVLARPSLDLADRTWATLSDGTPLVSAEKRGKGWLVLVHTTANAEWSDLALSGLFVEMLRRIVDLSQGVAARRAQIPLAPLDLLDGFGRLGTPPAGALPIASDALADTRIGPEHPPGYYGTTQARHALNLSDDLSDPVALGALPSGVVEATYGEAREVDIKPWLLVAALILAAIDLAASLALRRLLWVPRTMALVALVAGFAMAGGGAGAAEDDDEFAREASLETRLAYVVTDDPQTDETSRAGLKGLSVIVNRRTAAELADPVGVVPGIDELAFFPLLYWAVGADQPPLTDRATTYLNTYMRNGGTIVFDTRDAGGGSGGEALRRLASRLDIPTLVPVPADHVLTRSYYLLQQFPGRWTGATVWVERAGDRVNDGVSSVIVGANNWAAAWAMDDAQRPLYAVVPGGERQRETAYRFGINLIMYTLTGNYKSDQVHVPAIMQRLGQ